MKKFIAEFTGTFFLLFVGTGTFLLESKGIASPGNAGIAIAFGAIVAVMIVLLGRISGAHMNPAVSLGFYLSGKMKASELPGYMLSQFAGAILGSYLLLKIFPDASDLGMTFPNIGQLPSFLLEVVLSLFLMLVILFTACGKASIRPFAFLAIGTWIMIAAYVAGPWSGASMNPARSLAPYLFSSLPNTLSIYLIAPMIGAGLAGIIWKFTGLSRRY